jgi:hypothetical protein
MPEVSIRYRDVICNDFELLDTLNTIRRNHKVGKPCDIDSADGPISFDLLPLTRISFDQAAAFSHFTRLDAGAGFLKRF